jgi:cell division protein FtsW
MKPRQNSVPDEFAGIRRHRPDMQLLLFTAILALLGLVVIYAISPALIARVNTGGFGLDDNYFLYRQLGYLLAGIAAFAGAYMVPLGWWRRHSGKLVVAGIVLSLLPFLLQATPIASCVNGACRWIDVGFLTFQPAEFMKLTLVVFLAGFLATRISQGKLNDLHHTLIPVSLLLLAVGVVVVGLQKDLGTGLTLFGVVLSVLFAAGLKVRYFIAVGLVAAVLGVVFIIIAPHRIERVLTFVNHSSSSDEGIGYHINQALIAVGSGGLTGKGLAQSVQAFGYLPEAASDSIFAILAEKFGFLGTVAVLAVFAALFLRLLKIMEHTGALYPRLIVAGAFGWIFSHTVINIGAMLGIFPLTGVTLPFVSLGGTSLLCMLAVLGMTFQISRYTTFSVPQEGGSINEDRRRGRGIRGTRYPSFSSTART